MKLRYGFMLLACAGRAFAGDCPTITTNPQGGMICPTGSFAMAVTADGAAPLRYQWWLYESPIDFVRNPSAATSNLMLDGSGGGGPIELGLYYCIVSNDCGSAMSDATQLWYCRINFNCDSVIDFWDYLDFVAAFSGNLPNADFDHDGTIDFFDYLEFVGAFSSECD